MSAMEGARRDHQTTLSAAPDVKAAALAPDRHEPDAARPVSPGTFEPVPASQEPTARDARRSARRAAILVLGLHPSRAAMLIRVIHALGADVSSAPLSPVAEGDLADVSESPDIARLNDDILQSTGATWSDWQHFNIGSLGGPVRHAFKARALELLTREFAGSSLFVMADPRMSRLLPFWLEVLHELDADPKCLLPIGHPVDVAALLNERDNFSPAYAQLLWLRYQLEAEYSSRGLARAFLNFDDFIDDCRSAVSRLGDSMKIVWRPRSETAVHENDSFPRRRLADDSAADGHVPNDETLAPWVKETYTALMLLQVDADSKEGLNRLDRVRVEFDRASAALGAIVASRANPAEELAERLVSSQQAVESLEAQVRELQRALAAGREQIRSTTFENSLILNRLDAIQSSAAWQLSRPLRSIEYRWPRVIRGVVAIQKLAWWTINLRLPERLRLRRQANQLLAAGMFDRDWYVEHNPDIVRSGADVVLHWLVEGWKEGRDPNPFFNSDWYLAQNPDVAADGLNPLMHYLERGALERRDPNPLFDSDWYLAQNPDVAASDVNPLVHYVREGYPEGRDPSPKFKTSEYLARHPGLLASGKNPLAHCLEVGAAEGLLPSRGIGNNILGKNNYRYTETILSLPFEHKERTDLSGIRLAVVLHAFHPELVEEFIRYLANIRVPYNLFVSTDNEQKATSLRHAFRKSNQQDLEVKVVPNRGRDIGPKLIGFHDVYENHDLVLHLHTKISTHDSGLRGWRRFILECLLGSPAAVESVLDAFVRLPQLGMVGPRHFPSIRGHMTWGANFTLVRDLAARMAIAITPDSPLDFPSGSMFWARSAALKPLLDLNLRFDDFPKEAGQTDGTLAHAIERLYFYACEKAGYRWIHAGFRDEISAPEVPLKIFSVPQLQRLVSDQMPALLLPGVRPRPASTGPGQPDRHILTKQAFRERCMIDLRDFLREGRRLPMPSAETPKVSILLVLFNQAELTFHCLQTLGRALDVPAEVIILDNNSTDLTDSLLERIDGARIIRSPDNLHFLRGVNHAAAEARGSYLLLLNNDTRLTPGSIGAACSRLDSAPDVGAVGGKLVLLDGALQEAGSIIWRDGSCLGYGRGRDPGEPEFQFRRDVDYCSGAFLMVRRGLFEQLGRFDTAFAPAYYEETDLCMRIREAGFRVVYEPKVEVTHFEFGSSHTADSAIALQQRNRAIFVERHRLALKASHQPLESDILVARMRRYGIGRVLVIDDRLPFPALGAGYPRAAQLLKTLADGGWFVTFYPLMYPEANFEETYNAFAPETEIAAGLGKEGLVGFLRERTGYYDAVIVSRPHNMTAFSNSSRTAAGFMRATPAIYDAEAIFAEREAARVVLQGKRTRPEIQRLRIAEELGLARSARIVLAVNAAEADKFRSAGQSDVRVLGHALSPSPTPQGFAERSNLLFVGALDDDTSPNVDSLVWFAEEVVPLLERIISEPWVVNVVGRCSAPRVQAIRSPHIKLLGRIEDLRPIYGSARVFIAPTRYAAGVPMKVHEAAAFGVPIVATGVLASQLGWSSGRELLVADPAPAFADACRRAYDERPLWEDLRHAALDRVRIDCSPARFTETLLGALADATGKR
jgi:GT2 family glycosyltransferase/glycosyltransferase involved in cell wall biosynthesis